MMSPYSYDRTAARPDPRKPLSPAERKRMADEREEMVADDPHMGSSERRELEQEIQLLRNTSIDVGFNGVDVVRIAASAEAVTPELFRPMVIKAIKRIGDGVRAMGLGSVVKFNPQERIDTDRYGGIHTTFFLRFDHPQINPAYRPGINFYWYSDKKLGVVGTTNLVQRNKSIENLPLTKMDEAMLKAADAILADLKGQLDRAEPESNEAWSVVTLGKDHSYATEVNVFDSKSKAEAEARNLGNCYVVKGTQMWNEPLGQVEEHDRTAPSKFFK